MRDSRHNRQFLPPLVLTSFLLVVALPCAVFARPLNLAESLERHRQTGRLSSNVVKQLDQTGSAEVLVVLDDQSVQDESARLRRIQRLKRDSSEIIRFKSGLHRERKKILLSGLLPGEHEVLKDYDHFGVMFLKVSDAGVARLLDEPDVRGVYENRIHSLFLAESLPLIGQPNVQTRGYSGAGKTVAILDSGLYYTFPVFGSCTAPGTPASCKVVESVDIEVNDNSLDFTGHGTVVAEVVSRVAPDAKLVSLDVAAANNTASDAVLIEALNWVLERQQQNVYDFAAVNVSLGHGQYFTACDSDQLALPIASLRSAGILTVVASGNNGYSGSTASPACISTTVSVGAVYDGSGLPYNATCTDSNVFADNVTCFTNMADFLTMLAPGANLIPSFDPQHYYAGTSFSAPHVAGAIAVIAAAQPELTPDEIVARLTDTGKPVSVTRDTVTYQKTRLDLDAALMPRITASPSSVNFGTVPVGSSSLISEIVINNSGTALLEIQGLELGGSGSTMFSLHNDTCSGQSLPPGDVCSVGVRHQAVAEAAWNAVLAIQSNAPLNPTLEVQLSAQAAVVIPPPPIRLVHQGVIITYVDSLSAAYANAVTGDSIQLQELGINANLVCDTPDLSLQLRGGYSGDYFSQNGPTTIIGSLTVSGGRVTVDNLRIRPEI